MIGRETGSFQVFEGASFPFNYVPDPKKSRISPPKQLSPQDQWGDEAPPEASASMPAASASDTDERAAGLFDENADDPLGVKQEPGVSGIKEEQFVDPYENVTEDYLQTQDLGDVLGDQRPHIAV